VLRRVHRREIELELSGGAGLAPERASEIFRIAQEALTNALRHSGAAHIAVRLTEPNGRLLLTVEDDGVGFEPDAAGLRSRRLGLTSMEERAGALGGRLSVESQPGAGARIGLEVPLGDDSRPDRG
jgi:signal transduction histidine kinase